MCSAQSRVRAQTISPEEILEMAIDLKARDNIGVAFTYNEPLIAPEFIRDVGTRLHDRGLVSVVVTNGYVNSDTLASLLPVIDAINIDLKSFTEEGYLKLGAPSGLETVKKTIETCVNYGIHVEITTLLVPGFSDDMKLFEQQCRWLASLHSEIPLHISRFFPAYKEVDKSPTKKEVIEQASTIATRYLSHVFQGNI